LKPLTPDRKGIMEIDLNPTEHHLLLIEEQRDRVILLEAERYLIGRNDSNEIVLNHDPISREHATLLRVPVANEPKFIYRLMDGDAEGKPSTNGLFVNGQRQQCYDLVNDSVISFAGVINALYIKTFMTKTQVLEFMEWISSSPSAFSASEDFAATQLVESYLSKTDPTLMSSRFPINLMGASSLR
jgi:pSer/pThr/pTyr-binding forkhead associated (FHA) protein